MLLLVLLLCTIEHCVTSTSRNTGAEIVQGGVAGTLGLQNQWGMAQKCCNLRIGT